MSERRSCPSHCCLRHGCKYGYGDCPVAIGTIRQLHRCVWCVDVKEIEQEIAHALEELAWSKTFEDG